MADADVSFAGSMPELYASALVPVLFRPYARELAGRVARFDPAPRRVLEVAAGTGALTREIVDQLPGVSVLATDLSPAMLAVAAAAGTPEGVQWRQADAQDLPVEDASVDVVVCQFGIMFVPDRVQAYREARRVLAPGGRVLLAVWSELARNAVAAAFDRALLELTGAGGPTFLTRVPHGHGDPAVVERELRQAGFDTVDVDEVVLPSGPATADDLAGGFLVGTPAGREVPGGVEAAGVAAVAASMRAALGDGRVSGPMAALVVTAR